MSNSLVIIFTKYVNKDEKLDLINKGYFFAPFASFAVKFSFTAKDAKIFAKGVKIG
jgi:hypothetical protein